jgi:hypothetical protein
VAIARSPWAHFKADSGSGERSRYATAGGNMAKPKCYTPQLSREIVSRLYFKAKAECVPMTVLANRIMENALGNPEAIAPTAAEKRKQRKPD